MIDFNQIQFLTSAAKLTQLPADIGCEIAFAGRSNAGKSSAINAIVGKKIAFTSKTPGRTQLINYFVLNDKQRLVDLPGYGYAQVPDEVKKKWGLLLDEYFTQRQSLSGLILVMDIRHPLKPFDLQMLDWAESVELSVHVLLTKADKLSRGAGMQTLIKVKNQLANYQIKTSIQLFSAPKAIGIDEARNQLATWLNERKSAPNPLASEV